MISVFGWPDPNTGFDQSEHALYTCYFIICKYHTVVVFVLAGEVFYSPFCLRQTPIYSFIYPPLQKYFFLTQNVFSRPSTIMCMHLRSIHPLAHNVCDLIPVTTRTNVYYSNFRYHFYSLINYHCFQRNILIYFNNFRQEEKKNRKKRLNITVQRVKSLTKRIHTTINLAQIKLKHRRNKYDRRK